MALLQNMDSLYILELKDAHYYIGKTKNLKQRLDTHFGRSHNNTYKSSAWIQKWPAIKLLDDPITTYTGSTEDSVTLEYMSRYGIHKVRGGTFTQVKLASDTINIITQMLRSKKDLCFKCGQAGHFVSACSNLRNNSINTAGDDNSISIVDDEDYEIVVAPSKYDMEVSRHKIEASTNNVKKGWMSKISSGLAWIGNVIKAIDIDIDKLDALNNIINGSKYGEDDDSEDDDDSENDDDTDDDDEDDVEDWYNKNYKTMTSIQKMKFIRRHGLPSYVKASDKCYRCNNYGHWVKYCYASLNYI